MSSPEAPLTLGTAGHIDHGKTALVTLLTGKNTDRLREERERGISIELGYAQLELPSGRRLSVVDVPGHERFVRTMVAGATGIDLFLLVVAADDGVMPQTVEHLAILELLGVPRGVVAVTKADLVDEELLELVREDVVGFLTGTSYGEAPVIVVSARDGRGIPQLLGALEECAASVTAMRRDGPTRLPVDRSFALKGVGAVVTGTLWRGVIRAGDALSVEPGGRSVTVRSVQVHDRSTDVAEAGQRVAVNLRGVEKAEVGRGQWLVAPSSIAAVTRGFDASLTTIASARPLKTGVELRLHHGTAQRVARLTVLGQREVSAGAEALVRVRLSEPVAVEAGDRYILRALSPADTVGGGRILETGLRRWRDRNAQLSFLQALRDGESTRAIVVLARERGEAGVSEDDFAGAGVAGPTARTLLADAEQSGELEALGAGRTRRWFVPGTIHGLRDKLHAALLARGKERPERPFVSAAEVAVAAPGATPASVAALLADLVAAGELVESEGGFAVAGAGGALSGGQERTAARVLERLVGAGASPPTLASLAEELDAKPAELARLLDVLARRGALVRAEKDLWFAAATVGEARERLCDALARQNQITLAEFRDLLGTGRRHAQALLELFDREGVTRRQGDVRVARRRRG